MPELQLHREGASLLVPLDTQHISIPWSEVELTEERVTHLKDDAIAYGRALFDATFQDASMRATFERLRTGERVLLVSEDPLVSQIPWEYLRLPDGELLAGRFNLVRGIAESRHQSVPP